MKRLNYIKGFHLLRASKCTDKMSQKSQEQNQEESWAKIWTTAKSLHLPMDGIVNKLNVDTCSLETHIHVVEYLAFRLGGYLCIKCVVADFFIFGWDWISFVTPLHVEMSSIVQEGDEGIVNSFRDRKTCNYNHQDG